MAEQTPLALITGAGRGIGRATAIKFASEGFRVALIARTLTEISQLRSELLEKGYSAYAFVCDVSSSAEVEMLHTRISSELGPVSVLVNNAGVAPSEKLENTTDELWYSTLAINLTGPFYMCRAFVPTMKRNGGGSIVNVASTAAYQGFAYTAAYTASKHGLLGLTRALAVELSKANVRVNAVCPGFVRTQIVETSIDTIIARTGKSATDAEAELARLNKEGRLLEPEEIAETIFTIAHTETRTGNAFDAHGMLVEEG